MEVNEFFFVVYPECDTRPGTYRVRDYHGEFHRFLVNYADIETIFVPFTYHPIVWQLLKDGKGVQSPRPGQWRYTYEYVVATDNYTPVFYMCRHDDIEETELGVECWDNLWKTQA